VVVTGIRAILPLDLRHMLLTAAVVRSAGNPGRGEEVVPCVVKNRQSHQLGG
jgi:hypothetical protein